MLNSIWNGRSETRLVKVIDRLDIKQAANRLGMKYQDLYNAFYSNRAGGFIQRDPHTSKLYVLATEIDDLRDAMKRRAAGAVINRPVPATVEPRAKPMTLQDISLATGVPLPTLRVRRKKGQLPGKFVIGKRGKAFLYHPDVVKVIRPYGAKHNPRKNKVDGAATGKSELPETLVAGATTVITPAEANTIWSAAPNTRQEIAIELIRNGHEAAGIYLLTK